MAKIFVSYRRGDTADITGRICDRLESQFGRGSVFMDVDTIPFGVDFRQYINQAVGECDVVLAVIGAGWLAATDDDTGRRRLDNPDDFVRIEIEWALQRGIPLIPVLVRRVAMPGPEELPPGLQELAYRNAAEVRSGREFHTDMDRLMRDMQRHLLGGPEEAGTATGEGPASQSTAKAAPSMTETEGQCPECGRRNPAERKYCGGCGEPLFEPCLECQYVNAAWDKFCGQCGDDLAATRRARVQALEARQQQIEGLRKDSRHTEAIRMLEEMAAIEHPRLKPFRAWAQEWLSAVRAELEGLQRDREESARVAAEELSRHDYEAAIRSLEQIPEPLRGVKIQSLLADSRNKANEVMSLAREIRQAAELRRFESLGMKIRRLVSLKPHDGNVREVVGNAVGQVVTLAEARSAEHDYAQVVELLGQLPAPQRDAKARHLLEDAQTTLAEIGSLEVELKDVGCLEALEDLFSRLQNLRDRKPRYEEVNALVARLQERVAGAAERSITEHRYHEAVDLLRQVPPALRSDAVRNCLKESRAKAGKVSALANSIREARRAGNVKETFVHLKAFLELIPDHPEGRKLRERLPRETANKARRLCRVEHDYGEAVALLEDVPESLRSVEIRRLLEDCRAMAAETDRLTEEIDVEARRSWPRRLTRNGPERSQGQLANLERLLTLQPKNRHARSLLKGMIAQVEHSVTAYGTYSPVLRAVMFTPDGTHVLVAHSQGVDKWQLESGSTVNVLDSTWGKVTCIACSRDGTQMLCGREGGNVELWDLRRDSERQRGDDERSSDGFVQVFI
jgi:hypothetical protein